MCIQEKEISKLVNKIREEVKDNYLETDTKKVFYPYKCWFGWRFYLHAIINKDWQSIKEHRKIVSKYLKIKQND